MGNIAKIMGGNLGKMWKFMIDVHRQADDIVSQKRFFGKGCLLCAMKVLFTDRPARPKVCLSRRRLVARITAALSAECIGLRNSRFVL